MDAITTTTQAEHDPTIVRALACRTDEHAGRSAIDRRSH